MKKRKMIILGVLCMLLVIFVFLSARPYIYIRT